MHIKNLSQLLENSSQRYAQRIALVFGSKKITYKILNDLTSQIASGLLALGLEKGQRVGIFLDNCPEFVISYYAVLKAGLVAVPINYMFKTEETKFILEDSAATCLITSPTYLEMAEELRLRIDSLKIIMSTRKSQADTLDLLKIRRHEIDCLANIEIGPQDPAVILYTSGTTGQPKGAVLSHGNLVSNAQDCAKIIQVNFQHTFICILPLFHSFAATVCMNLPLLVGAKIVLMKSLRPFKRLIRAIRKHRVRIFVAIPSLYHILAHLKLPKLVDTPLIRLFNPVKLCISGAAALPKETFFAFEKRFRIPLLEGYGLTEASPVVTLNPPQGLRKSGSIGKSISERIKLKIVDPEGRELEPEKIGELLVKGPNVMQGYYQKPQATQEAIKDGWLYTGDMAKFDQDGYVYIVGRKKEMINVRGLNVYPREIEEVLYQNPKIKEAAVIGVLDSHKGEVPKAFIVLKEKTTASEQEILQYLRQRLANYKIPKYIEFREELPKNTTGKILKRLLK